MAATKKSITESASVKQEAGTIIEMRLWLPGLLSVAAAFNCKN